MQGIIYKEKEKEMTMKKERGVKKEVNAVKMDFSFDWERSTKRHPDLPPSSSFISLYNHPPLLLFSTFFCFCCPYWSHYQW